MNAKFETYSPKKNIFEKVHSRKKVVLIVFSVLFLVSVTVFATEKLHEDKVIQKTVYVEKPVNSVPVSGQVVKSLDLNSEKQVSPDYCNFKNAVMKTDFIKDLPKSSKISLRFYNFDTGERQWEKSFMLSRNSIVEGISSEVDIEVIVHSKYVNSITSENLCQILSESKNNGDFSVSSEISTTSLILKYSSMMKYKDCLGI